MTKKKVFKGVCTPKEEALDALMDSIVEALTDSDYVHLEARSRLASGTKGYALLVAYDEVLSDESRIGSLANAFVFDEYHREMSILIQNVSLRVLALVMERLREDQAELMALQVL